MEKYGVILTKGNEITVLGTYAAKEAALEAKDLQRCLHKGEDCHIDAIKGEFDENDRLLYNRYRIYYR